MYKISDTSREKLLSDENNQDIRTQFKWARKSSAAAGCKGNTVGLSAVLKSSVNLLKYCSAPHCEPLMSGKLSDRKEEQWWYQRFYRKCCNFAHKTSLKNLKFKTLKATHYLILMIIYWLIKHVQAHIHMHADTVIPHCGEIIAFYLTGMIISVEFLKA